MIHLDGTVERLTANNEDSNVDEWEMTNGAKGINSVSRHIVYVGGVNPTGHRPMDTRTEAQKETLEKYVKDFVAKNPTVKVAGHNQFSTKACPSFDVEKWCRDIGIDPKNIYLK
jgi:hypothetical protein